MLDSGMMHEPSGTARLQGRKQRNFCWGKKALYLRCGRFAFQDTVRFESTGGRLAATASLMERCVFP